MWRLVHQWSFVAVWLFLTIVTLLLHCWYSLGRPVTIGTPMVLSVFDDWYSVSFVKNSQKTVKQQKNDHWCTNHHMSIQSPPNTQSHAKWRKRRYLARPTSHVPGQWPQPVARGQGWLCVSTWTSMRLTPVRCRVLLHSLLPTDDACSSSVNDRHQIFHIFGPHSQTFCSPDRTP